MKLIYPEAPECYDDPLLPLREALYNTDKKINKKCRYALRNSIRNVMEIPILRTVWNSLDNHIDSLTKDQL